MCEACETQAEMRYSFKALDKWLRQQVGVSDNLREFTEDYLEKSFMDKKHKLCQCFFQDIYGGNLGSNSISEQENSALKRDCMGPRPNSGIDRTVIETSGHERRRLKEVRRQRLQSLSQTANEYQSSNETDDDDIDAHELLQLEMKVCDKVELSRVLVDFATKDLIRQYDASVNYLYHALSTTKFLVRRLTWDVPPTNTVQNIHNAYVPKFDRTRVVEISNSKFWSVQSDESTSVIVLLNIPFLARMLGVYMWSFPYSWKTVPPHILRLAEDTETKRL